MLVFRFEVCWTRFSLKNDHCLLSLICMDHLMTYGHVALLSICLSPGYALLFLFNTTKPVLSSKMSKLASPSEQGESQLSQNGQYNWVKKKKKTSGKQKTFLSSCHPGHIRKWDPSQFFNYVLFKRRAWMRQRQWRRCQAIKLVFQWHNAVWQTVRQEVNTHCICPQVPCFPLLALLRLWVFWWPAASSTPSTMPHCTSWKASPSCLLPSFSWSPVE